MTVLLVVLVTVAVARSHGQVYNRDLTNDEIALTKKSFPDAFQAVEGWATLPAGRTWGSPSQVEIDPDGKSVWVAERCGADTCEGSNLAPILKFDANGTLVKSFGAGMFVFPHGIHIDQDHNVWVTDGQGKNGKGHQVFKFSPEGKVLLTLGKAGIAGSGEDTLNQPSDIAIAPNGDIFVADGHSPVKTPRIVKFSKDGRFIKAWGTFGSDAGQLQDPHCIEMDSRGRLFVCDRRNDRIQVFDQEGNSLARWTQFGRPSGIFIDKDDRMFVANQELGIVIGSAKDGSVTGLVKVPTNPNGRTRAAESVARDAAGNLYAGEIGAMRLMKYVKK
jgi:DNA-binding beta-propeller fold protein YncE